MSYDPDFEKRIQNKIDTVVETQANLQEAIAGLIQVARLHDGQLDDIREQMAEHSRQMAEHSRQMAEQMAETRRLIAENSRQIAENSRQIAELREQGREQDERLDALIRIVETHVSNHP
jgi:septal ring factor EnvC (AmiA/AmiB activator)